MGGGVFELGNPEGRGAQAVLEIQVEGGGTKTVPSVVGVWIFSGITQYQEDNWRQGILCSCAYPVEHPDKLRAWGSLKTFMAWLKIHYFKLAFSL